MTATVALVAVPLAGIPAAHAASSNPKDEAPAASVASGQGRKSSAAAHNAPATRTGDTSAAPDSKSAQHGGAGDKSTPKSAAIGNGQAATKPAAKSADGPTSQAAAAQTSATGKSASPQGKDQSKGTKASANNQSNAQTLPSGNADLNQLLRLWGVFGAHLHIHCSELQIGDLRCLADRGNLATLERYNRPALLVIQHGTGLQTVLLSAINKKQKTVTLVGGQGARNVDIQLLKSVWTGRFEMIWRADAGVRLIRPGSVGSAVVWLRKRLTRINGKPSAGQADPQSPVYDASLGARLKAFQRSHGLRVDGIVGPRTQIMLNGAVPSPGTPTLKPQKKNKK